MRQGRLLSGFLIRVIFFHAEHEVQNMCQPDAGQNAAGENQPRAQHHTKAERHQKRDRAHDFQLCAPRHALPLYKGFQIIPVELCAGKPAVQLFGAFPKAEQRQHQKRHGRQNGQHRAQCAQPQPDKTEQQPYDFFNFHDFLSPEVSSHEYFRCRAV